MADVVLDKVSKRYPGGVLAVSALDASVVDGEFVVLLGPSGCGKSTVLNLVAGLTPASSGELRIGGRRVNETPPWDRELAMVFRSYALYPHLSVRENLAFPLRLAKLPDATVRRRVGEVAERLELIRLLDHRPASLSGGQRQRVAIGRAIVRRVNALLMDEPMSTLDANVRTQLRSSVSELQRELGTTTLYGTHDQSEAMELADRVVVLRDGHVQQTATPRQLIADPANLFVAAFVGAPPMNLLPGTITEGAIDGPLGTVPLSPAVRRALEEANAGREVIVGIRPEAFGDVPMAGGCALTVRVDAVETIASQPYALFTLAGGDISSPAFASVLDQLMADDGGEPGAGVLARLSPETSAWAGVPIELWFDPESLVVFDPDTGDNLSHPAGRR